MRLSIANPKSKIQNGRLGLSLTEVLIAIFVMAVGMIALLTLFPVGILNMTRALRDSRMASVCQQAQVQIEMPRVNGLGQIYTMSTDTAMEAALRLELPNQNTTAPVVSRNPYFFDVTPGPLPIGAPLEPALFPTLLASPPVFIDPQGNSLWPNRTIGTDPADTPLDVVHRAGPTVRSFGVRRSGVTFAVLPGQIRRTFMIEDELSFEPNGEPRRSPVTGLVERERKNSWAYMWRRPRYSEPKLADMTVAIFHGRQVEGVTGFGQPPEPYFRGHFVDSALGVTSELAFVAGSNIARLKFDATAWQTLPAKRGDIVLDATVIPAGQAPGTGAGLSFPLFNGYFYKIVGVGDPVLVGGTMYYQELTLARPALADGYVGVMMTGLAEVVEKSEGKMPPG